MIKILKHDFKNSYKEFLIMSAALLVMSIFFAITTLLNLSSVLGIILFMTAFSFYSILLTAICILWIIFIINSINKKFFSKEGYLTFTTPVSVDKLIISKILVNFTWFIVILMTFCISFLIIVFIATSGDLEIFNVLFHFTKELFKEPLLIFTSLVKIILYVLSVLITLFFTLAFLSSINVRKARSVITLFIFSSILSVGDLIISLFSIYSVGIGYNVETFKNVICFQYGYLTPGIGVMLPFNDIESIVIMYFSFNQFLGMLAYIVGLYFITRYLMTKKLELDSN